MRRAAALAAAGAALFAPETASAHAFLVRSTPSPGASVQKSPARVLLVFDEAVSPAHLDVTKAGGGSVRAGRPTQPRPDEIAIPLRHGLAKGGYVVHWSEVDVDDGHLISGVFAFGVRTAPPAVHASSGSSFRLGDAIGRWLVLAGLLIAAGLVVARRFLRPVRPNRFIVTSAAGAVATVAGTVVLLARQPGFLTTRFDRTTLAGGLVAAVSALFALASTRSPRLRYIADAGFVVLLALPTLDGHAVAPGRPHWLTVPSDLAHVVAASVWIGGVYALAVLVPRTDVAASARRFAPVALLSVAVLGASGILRAYVELHSFSQLWSTAYGEAILAKSALFAAALAVAAVARGRPDVAEARLEGGVLFVLVVAVAVLTGLRPGRDVPPGPTLPKPAPVVTATEVGAYAVGVALTPGQARATVLGIDGPASGLTVSFGVGARIAAAKPCGAGCYLARLPVAAPRRLSVRVGTTSSQLRLPDQWPAPSAATIVGQAERVFAGLRTLTVVSSLASAPGNAIITIYRMQAPDRLSGVERRTGAAEVIIGAKRWDRDSTDSAWVESDAVPIHQPSLPWPRVVHDPHLLGESTVRGHRVFIVSFVDTVTPSWFRIAVDEATGRTLSMDMIATAHFMHEDYRGFDAPLVIAPPRS